MSYPGQYVVYLWDEVCITERVGVGLWSRRVVRFFYLEVTGEAVLIEKPDRRNAISIYISIANSFTAESALFMPNYSSAIPNSF